jgi:hypothetical protein
VTIAANQKDRLLRPQGRHADETPYDVVVVCLWFVFGVAVTALVLWLALGGEL